MDRSVEALDLARMWGADYTVVVDGGQIAKVREIINGLEPKRSLLSRQLPRQKAGGHYTQNAHASHDITQFQGLPQ